jgi:hypothetical protein
LRALATLPGVEQLGAVRPRPRLDQLNHTVRRIPIHHAQREDFDHELTIPVKGMKAGREPAIEEHPDHDTAELGKDWHGFRIVLPLSGSRSASDYALET